jgi:hypothetical protein
MGLSISQSMGVHGAPLRIGRWFLRKRTGGIPGSRITLYKQGHEGERMFMRIGTGYAKADVLFSVCSMVSCTLSLFIHWFHLA